MRVLSKTYFASKSLLDDYTINLNDKAKKNKLDPVIGRTKELSSITSVLLKRTKNNPLLLGLPGVGKTAIAEELARSIVNKTCHDDLKDKEVLLLDTVGLVAGTMERGSIEDRMMKFIEELSQRQNIILMIDEIHTLVTSTNSSNNKSKESSQINISNMLKPGLARGLFHCIGATTYSEYSKYLCNDKAFERRFRPIYIEEPSMDDTLNILNMIKENYEEYHTCTISNEAIDSCVTLSYRFLPYRNFPDKSIDLLDESCSRVNIEYHKNLRDNKHVDSKDVENVIQQIINIPLSIENEDVRIKNLEKGMKKIIGQDHVVASVLSTIKRFTCGFYDMNRPIASLMFVGPTGTGKTEIVNILAQSYFGSKQSILRFDMSEYMEPHTVASLIGAPPGYVGYDDGGKLLNLVKNNPYSVILFDEIEKAHYKIYDLLLQILEDGHLTNSTGTKVSFKNNIIVMTSNVGYTKQHPAHSLGFQIQDDVTIKCSYNKQTILEELKYTFRPELLNRIDNILVFEHLDKQHIIKIANEMIEKCIRNIFMEKNINVLLTNETREKIYETGLNTNYGARPLRNSINKHILNKVSEQILLNPEIKRIVL